MFTIDPEYRQGLVSVLGCLFIFHMENILLRGVWAKSTGDK